MRVTLGAIPGNYLVVFEEFMSWGICDPNGNVGLGQDGDYLYFVVVGSMF